MFYNIFDMTMSYTEWNYIPIQSFVLTSAIVREDNLLKWKNNNNNEKMIKQNWSIGESDLQYIVLKVHNIIVYF